MSVSSPSSSFQSYIAPGITFVSGAAYGFTNVIVGQPWDVVKTRLQALPTIIESPLVQQQQQAHRRRRRTLRTPFMTSYQILKDLYSVEGLRGLYRGGVPMVIGGSLMRSVQYGVSSQVQTWLQRNPHVAPPPIQVWGFIHLHVLIAGAIGGMARSLVEIPTDFIKIRRQVRLLASSSSSSSSSASPSSLTWTDVRKHVFDGSGVTLVRNTFLFSSFIIYIDISKQFCTYGYVPSWLCTEDGMNLTPFAKGAICANLAWITIWPLDLIKTQQQSGIHVHNNSGHRNKTTTNTMESMIPMTHKSVGAYEMLLYNLSKGQVFRGLLPGLIRSTLANGASMVAYEWTQTTCTRYFDVERKDIV